MDTDNPSHLSQGLPPSLVIHLSPYQVLPEHRHRPSTLPDPWGVAVKATAQAFRSSTSGTAWTDKRVHQWVVNVMVGKALMLRGQLTQSAELPEKICRFASIVDERGKAF